MKNIYTYILLAALALNACGPSEAEKRHNEALALDAQIDSALTAGDNALVLELIDTLNTRYRTELDLRRASNAKHAQAVSGLSLSKIPEVELQIAALQTRCDSLEALFTSVQPASSLPPYLIYKGISKDFMAKPCVQARVNTGQDALDVPYTLAVNAGSNIGANSLTVTTSSGSTFTMPAGSADGVTASVTPENAQKLVDYLADTPGEKAVNARIQGTKGNVTVKLTDTDSKAIAAAGQLAATRAQLRAAMVTSDKLNALIQASRDQQARSATN